MYKCTECGHIFEEGEARIIKENHGLPGGWYEEFGCCPVCGGDFEATHYCKRCGGAHLEEELYDGICSECLSDALTYDTALQFLQDSELLDLFMFRAFFGCPEPEYVSPKLIMTLRELFLRQKADDILCGKTDFFNLLYNYIMWEDMNFGKQSFAEWLNEKR